MRLNTPVVDSEFLVSDDLAIVSMTDLKGHINYANPYFIEASGYSEEELIGAPQNILRHPDMPASAFADLWATIKSGLPWMGLVKNRRKNGEYYWVQAIVTPIIENGVCVGYTSVRSKPSREQVTAATNLYKIERENPGSVVLDRGRVVGTGRLARLKLAMRISLGQRIGIAFSLLLAVIGALGWVNLTSTALAESGLNIWLGGLAGLAMVATALWLFLARTIVAPLQSVIKSTQAMAGGDLTGTFETSRPDEMGQLMRALYQLNTNLHSILGDIRNNFGSMLTATANIANGNVDLSERTDSQAASLEETAASMEELTSTVKLNADHSTRGTEVARKALGTADKGGAIMGKIVSTINDISESSVKISDIVGIINGIASPLMARPPIAPPAGPTGRCSASTLASKRPATRAASRKDIAASGPPSDTARIDFNMEHSPRDLQDARLRSGGALGASQVFRPAAQLRAACARPVISSATPPSSWPAVRAPWRTSSIDRPLASDAAPHTNAERMPLLQKATTLASPSASRSAKART